MNKERLIKIYQFLGRDVVIFSLLNCAIGLGLFFTEYAFAFSIQQLLAALGVANSGVIKMPHWLEVLRGFSLNQSLILIASLMFFRSLCQWIQNYAQNAACYSFCRKLRNRILNWVFRTESVNTAEVVTFFGDRTTEAGNAILFLQMAVFQGCVTLLLGVILFIMLPMPTLVAVLLLVVIIIPLKQLVKSTGGSGASINRLSRASVKRLLLSLQNLLFLKIYSLEEQERISQQKNQDDILAKFMHYFRIAGIATVLPNTFGILIICGLIYVLHTLGAEPGILISYFYLFYRFLQNAASTSQQYTNFAFFLPSVEELGRWWMAHSLDSPRAPASLNEVAVQPFVATPPYGWSLKNITFSYAGMKEILFENFSLDVRPRETLVLIGPSGTGKSTLVGLLLDQLRPQKGMVEIVDSQGKHIDIKPVRKEFLQKIGYVGPEPFLFDGTLRENLCYGLLHAPTDAEVAEAVARAECQFIYELKDTYNHRITDQGQGLSAGQKQRIAFARALLRKPSILILDEATANLDMETEKSLIETLRNLKKNLTVVIVTHRESLLVLADQVLDLGKM